MGLIVLIVIVLLIFGGVGGYNYGDGSWNGYRGGGIGLGGVVLILVVLYLLGIIGHGGGRLL